VSITAGDTDTTFNADVVLDGLTLTAAGTVTFGDETSDRLTISSALTAITTAAANQAITVNSATTLESDLTISAGNAEIELNGTVDGNQNLVLNTTGITDINGEIGNATPLDTLITDVDGTTTFHADATAVSGRELDFNDDVVLGDDVVMNGTTLIDFAKTVNSDDTARDLTLNSPVTGFHGVVGGTDALDTLITDAAGTTTFHAGATAVSGSELNFNDDVVLGDNVIITGTTTATFRSTVNGPHDLTLVVSGPTTFGGAVGLNTAIGDGTGAAITINSTGATEFQSTVATAAGITQADSADRVTFRDDVSIAAGDTNTTFNADVVLDGLTLTAAGTVTFGDETTDALTISAALTTITTADENQAITVNSATTMNADLTVSAGNAEIELNGTVDGNHDLILNTTGITDINGEIGCTIPIASITTNVGGTVQIGADITAQGGTMTFNDAVVLDTQAITLIDSGGSGVIFNSSVDGSQVLILIVTGQTTFGGAVGGTDPLTTLSVSGPTQLDGGSVTTKGTQTYHGAVTLGANTTLTGTTIHFPDDSTSTVAGPFGLEIYGNANFQAPVGVGWLMVRGATQMGAGHVGTMGNQTYFGVVSLGKHTTMSVRTVSFWFPISGGFALSIGGDAHCYDSAFIFYMEVSGEFNGPCSQYWRHRGSGGGGTGAPAIIPQLTQVGPVVEQVVIPVTGTDPVQLNQYQPSILVSNPIPSDGSQIPNGDGNLVIIPDGIGDTATIVPELPESVPNLPDDVEIISAMTLSIFDGEETVDVITGDEPIILSFAIPPDMNGSEFKIIYWDPTLDNGLGGWIELEMEMMTWDPTLNNGLGGWTNSMSPLFDHVPAPVGLEQRIGVQVDFTGLFVLVAKD